MEAGLDEVDKVCVSSVLEDCIDQLVILGKTIPASLYTDPFSAKVVQDDIAAIFEEQERLLALDSGSGGDQKKNVKRDIKATTQLVRKGIMQNPLSNDNMKKIQEDRTHVEAVLSGCLEEIRSNGTFEGLSVSVVTEQEAKAKVAEIIEREDDCKQRVKTLQKQIVEVNRLREREFEERNEMIAHLKDQIQELKAKTQMEAKFVKKSCTLSVAEQQKMNQMSEQELDKQIQELNKKISEESRCNYLIEEFLRNHTMKLSTLQDEWNLKFDTEVARKRNELDTLKMNRSQVLETYSKLIHKFQEYELVIEDEKRLQEAIKRKKLENARQLAAVIKIATWWRKTMERLKIGPFRKKKGKKGKKGKGKGKGKGKKGKKK